MSVQYTVSLTVPCLQARDINLDIKRVVAYRYWCNKLWNAIRFAMMNLPQGFTPLEQPAISQQLTAWPPAARWILSRLNQAVAAVNAVRGGVFVCELVCLLAGVVGGAVDVVGVALFWCQGGGGGVKQLRPCLQVGPSMQRSSARLACAPCVEWVVAAMLQRCSDSLSPPLYHSHRDPLLPSAPLHLPSPILPPPKNTGDGGVRLCHCHPACVQLVAVRGV